MARRPLADIWNCIWGIRDLDDLRVGFDARAALSAQGQFAVAVCLGNPWGGPGASRDTTGDHPVDPPGRSPGGSSPGSSPENPPGGSPQVSSGDVAFSKRPSWAALGPSVETVQAEDDAEI